MANWIIQVFGSFKNSINKGHSRSVKAKKNIVISLLVKGISIAVSLLMVPLTLDYLNNTKYGIWLTVSSFITWLSFFDIGLGHGLRNKFAEAKARGKLKLARIYVSTTYAVLGIIIGCVFILFFLINPFLNWSQIFNAPPEMAKELAMLVLLVVGFFCMQFVLDLVGVVLAADQETAVNDLLRLIGSVISLLIVFILTKTTGGSLFYFGLAFSGTSVLVFFIASVALYKTKYLQFSPSFKFVRFRFAKKLFNLGVQFFVIQIVWIIMFSTDNIIISQLFGPEEVGPYNIAYKYFGMITMAFSVLTTPFWSAYTEAFTKGDIAWIKNINKKLKLAWLLLVGLSIIMLFISPYFYDLWIGDKLIIPFTLSLLMCIYVITVNWGSIFVIFLNGVGKVRLQLYVSIAAGIANIPLSILFAKTFNLGSAGVILATTICLSFGPILAPIQYRKVINNTAKGIWNK
jgi:O-antigen/teichoic acid export membrane protein